MSVRTPNANARFGVCVFGLIVAAPAAAFEFERNLVQGIVNVDVSYGIAYRLDDPASGLIGIANGGTEASVNGDDGELNQDQGIVSQMLRGTGEMTVAFENFGIYARAAAFDDWVQDGATSYGDRLRRSLLEAASRFRVPWSPPKWKGVQINVIGTPDSERVQ